MTKNLYCTKQTNVVLDQIDNGNMPHVLADLHVAKSNGPRYSLIMHAAVQNASKLIVVFVGI